MIQFENLTKSFWVNGRRKIVFENLNFSLPTGKSVALLGRNGAGKSTLLQIVAGTMNADSGRIVSDGSISWPIGLAGGFHKDLSGAQNVRFIARIYGVDTNSLVTFVKNFAELGPHFHMPVRSYSSGMRSRLVFGAAMGIRFDTYLIDEVTAVGDAAFKRKSRAVFRERVRSSSALMVSHNMRELREFCDSAVLLNKGRVKYFEDVNDAIDMHERNMAG
ncbi:ABC transporter ATP-binding protein [Sinisalibacter lacisalsi]|uniref:ATP-binding protein n=1 Tax=Sinisalibacter lacisalsi TaxID=1526570 RepID=A0ABQ1QBT5_9RHOB|nr:ABC transporter ATP-binding protein [Sinisalibacter lacisalsi]GGD21008.1 ATP-binding protein [Sinisalibacter lacisalsi]